MTLSEKARLVTYLQVGLAVLLTALTVRSVCEAQTVNEEEEQVISLYQRQSKTIRAPWPVARVSVTDPKIADVQMLTPQEILLQGKTIGSTDLVMWSKDERVRRARVDVEVDLRRMKSELTKLFPNSRLRVVQAQGVTVIGGVLTRAEHAFQLENFMDSSGIQYVNMTTVAGIQQVLLQVKIAEVSRTALRLLGINAFMTGTDAFGASVVGSSGGGPINPISIGLPGGVSAAQSRLPFIFTDEVGVSSSVTVFAGFPELGFEMFLQALAENRYLRVLAEPNLVAMSGHEASFLAGGEYPIPIVQGSTAGGGTSITIEYREFGVQLSFTPTVLGDGCIRLHVVPQVSQLSDIGAVEVEGFQIPALQMRRAETTLELKDGQTFALAGLINRVSSATSSRAPWIGDVPVLGALFRSVRYQNEETDLVVMVTASLVEPMSIDGRPPLPGFAHTTPNDWQLYALGMIEGDAPAKLSTSQSSWLKRRGLDELRGPGAWANYGMNPGRSRAGEVPPEPGMTPEEQAIPQ